ncbi:diguanylate cyclase/phosphodiesterase (GGDEF & EAL domains) with PAS/PAC sensor(s) [hydrothermal vent metagenome]|uniref:Diguanylate cyclase/phosphodiesterase (GGDEF & EAL domains) with PAS/PAC sensor(S) n=1 Tax=hydrothermal vent metagenome TaxID=652676 RepID=A0A3B1CQH0_9ZZZZ
MSLSRQLIIIVSLLFLLGFAGTFYKSISNMRSYLVTQLESHAQDTATSLGLSLQPSFAEGDIATMDTMVNAIFDGGYYREITVEKADGSKLIERLNEVQIEGVPLWFIKLIPLDTPRREALISAGWKPGAKVYVRSHPGYAYVELWESSEGTFWWFTGGLVFVWFLLVIVLRIVLAPLKAVEGQALAISEREFPVLEKLPWTKELRSVVLAMNKMSRKVKRIVTEQTDLAERMRREAYEDQVTGLGNRRSFDIQLKHMVTAKDEISQGALVMVRIGDFVEYNTRFGWADGNKLLVEVANLLKGKTKGMRNAILARIGGAEFAVLAHNTTVEDAEELAKLIGIGLEEFEIEGLEKGVAHIGIGFYSLDQTASKLLAQADMALRHAQQKGPNAWHIYEAESLQTTEVMGAHEWKGVIEGVVKARSISFLYQPAKAIIDGSTLHYEALARINGEDGSLIPAAVFMPMVERLELTMEVDRILVQNLLDFIVKSPEHHKVYAINLFSASVHNAGFVDWLLDTLSKNKTAASRLIFEVPEYGALSDIESFGKLVNSINETGAKVTIDNFGSTSTALSYLRGLKLEFIKIDGSYIKDIGANKDNQLFIQAITEVAHGLDIHVVAKSVESDEDLKILRELHVDGAQGYFTGKPQETPEG